MRLASVLSIILVLAGCRPGSGGGDGGQAATTVAGQPALYAIDTLVRSLVLEGVDLHLRYAEHDGRQLKLVLALYNNGAKDLLTVQGIAMEQATLQDDAAASQVVQRVAFEQGIVPEGGWYAGGALNGSLTFAPVSGSRWTFQLPGFPPVAFRLDVPLRVAPEPTPPDEGVLLLGFEARSTEPGVRVVLERVEVTANHLNLAMTEVLDPTVIRTSGISFDGAAIFDRRWNQYRPTDIQGSDAQTEVSDDGQTETTPFVLRFPRPQAGNVILLRIPGFPLIRVPLRPDDAPAWADARDLPPSYQPHVALATPDQPLARSDDPHRAFERLLHTLNLAFESGDRERYLDAFIPGVRAEQAALFARTQALPLTDVALVSNEEAQPEAAAPDGVDGQIIRSALWNYRVDQVDAQNVFSSPVELVMEREGNTWRIAEVRGNVPFWADGPTEVQRSGAFWIFFRPDDRAALATVEEEVEVAFQQVRAVLPNEAKGPFVMFVTATADEFAVQTGRDPERFAGAALSRWSFQNDLMTISSAAFYINGAAFRTNSGLDRQQTITHELTHLVLAQQTMPYTPLWLVEGVAMYVAEDVPAATMQGMWDTGAVESWSLDEFTAVRRFGEHDPEGHQAAAEYAYSAYLVRYLIATYGLDRFMQLYAAFGEIDGASIHDDMAEASTPPMVEPVMSRLTLRLTPPLLQTAFDVDMPTLEQSFKAWLSRDMGDGI